MSSKDGDQFYISPDCGKMSITKMISKTDTNYFLNLRSTGAIMVEEPKGLTLLLSEAKPLIFEEEEINVSVNQEPKDGEQSYNYELILVLKKHQVLLLMTHDIVAYKLYIFDEINQKEDSERLKQFAQCVF